MTDLSQQTEQLLKAFNTLHTDLQQLNVTCMITGALVFAILLVVGLRKR